MLLPDHLQILERVQGEGAPEALRPRLLHSGQLSPPWLIIRQFYLSLSGTPTTVQVLTGREHDIHGLWGQN